MCSLKPQGCLKYPRRGFKTVFINFLLLLQVTALGNRINLGLLHPKFCIQYQGIHVPLRGFTGPRLRTF